jgi:hypothetical protein
VVNACFQQRAHNVFVALSILAKVLSENIVEFIFVLIYITATFDETD